MLHVIYKVDTTYYVLGSMATGAGILGERRCHGSGARGSPLGGSGANLLWGPCEKIAKT